MIDLTAVATRRRWPLLVIGASAGTATWSGWVGLGTLTGFGVVHPLPGIWDGATLNTAITLPVGVEAYAVYALSVATDPRPLQGRARRYAWVSAATALGLGMAGQVAFHLMDAGREVRAPWWVVALVSCLPVAVLGAASLLWHLAGYVEPTGSDERTAPEAVDTPAPTPLVAPAPRAVPPRPSSVGSPAPAPFHADDAALVAAVMASDPIPSARQIKATHRIGQARAARIRAAALAQLAADTHLQPQQAKEGPSTETPEAPEIPENPIKIITGEGGDESDSPTGNLRQFPSRTDTHATALP